MQEDTQDAAVGAAAGRDPLIIGRGWFAIDPHVIIYSTLILLMAYALYDEGDETLVLGKLLEIVGISIAPLLALAMAHMFSESLDLQIRYGRRLNRHDRRHLLRTNVQYLYVAIPPSLLLGVLAMLQWNAENAVGVMLLLGLVSLCFWGVYAARQAHLGPWRQASFGLGYGLMGLIVLVIELILTH